MSPRIYAYIGIACIAISFVIHFYIFLPLAIFLGYKASKDGEEKLGKIVFYAAIVLLILVTLSALVQYFYGNDIPVE